MKLPKMRKIARGGGNLSGFVIAAAVCVATVPSPSWAGEDVFFYNTADGTASYGPETQIDKTGSEQRLLVYQGTVNINSGAYVKVGGNTGGWCNFIGIDKTKPAAMNINGGTVWCSTSGGGAGILGVGSSNKGITSTLTLNSGLLKVDTQLRSSTAYNSLAGCTSSGTITINGGEAEVKQVVFGASSSSTGTSTLTLNGGVLTVQELNFQPYNGQVFTWQTAMLKAARANIFRLDTFAESGKTRTMQITGTPTSFDTAGYAQTIPAFTGAGRLRLTGGGAVTFTQSTLTHGLVFDDITINLGTLDAGAARITTTLLEIMGPATLNVTLPESPSGRYPLIACTSTFDGSIGQITVSGGGAGVLVRDGKTLYLSFDPADAAIGLVYSAAAGGTDTPAESSYTRLAFTDTAGAFTVGASSLTFSQDIADASVAAQDITAPVTLSTANSSIYVAEGGRLTLSGGLTATTPRKDGPGTLVLDNATMPAEMSPRRGILDLGGNTYSGKLNFSLRRYNGEEITLTNGTWRPSMQYDLRSQGPTITVADGFTVDLTANANSRVLTGNLNVNDEWQETKVIVDGGTIKTIGNKSNVCNFIGVDQCNRAILEVRRGLFQATGSNGGTIRIGTGPNANVNGTVRVSGGTFTIVNDLSMGTVYNGLNGGGGNGAFELSGGLADVGNFYIGATSSSAGSSAATLTGGVLEVGVLKCLAYNKQTLLADGATIRAKNNDTAAAPFMSKAASADGYEKTYTIGAGGLTVDTAGYAVHCNIPWTGEGGITITGAGGSLALPDAPLFTGDVVVSNETALVVTNSATFAGKVVLGGADAKIRFDTTSYTEDSLTFSTDGITLPEGADNVLDFVELVGDGYIASASEDGKSIVLSLAANVAAFAWWTGAANDGDFANPVNWACTNSTGGVVENALPVKSTVVVLSGATSFTVPAGTTPIWATTQIGDGNGAVALGADCDWTAAPNVTIADGSCIDLNGHSLKVSYLTAEADAENAYVTNSVAGTKPALWTENAFAENEYIDTEKVTVYTDALEVKSVNNKTFTAPTANFASAMDASCIVTGGVMNVGGMVYLGNNNHDALFCVSNSATAQFYQFRVGNYDAGHNRVVVADNATLKITGGSANHMTVGHHNSVESVFTQDGGTVTVAGDCNIGVGNSATSRYEIASGSLTVGGSFVIGRLETTAGFGKLVQSGGTVRANKYISIGWNNGSVGLYYMSGGEFFISANRANLGSEAAVKMGIWDISGGTATTAKGLNVARQAGCTAKLRLSGSGKLVTADIIGEVGASTVEFDGGTLVATNVAANGVFLNGIKNVVFGANAVTIDTAGHGLGIANCVLKATPGARAITLSGGGTLDFTDTTLDFTTPLAGGFTLAKVADGDAATFTGVPALAPGVRGFKVKLYADGKTIKVLSKGCVIIVK